MSTAKVEKIWVERSRRDPLAFIEYISEQKPGRHHRLWTREILDPDQDRLLIVSAREAAKTTYMVYFMAWLIGKAPWSTNLIVSVSRSQARERLRVVKEIIEHNPRFRNVFPHVHLDKTQPNDSQQFTVWSEKWTEDATHELTQPQYRAMVARRGDPRNPTIFADGSGSSAFVGKRCSGFALVDDPHDIKNSATEDLRQKLNDWFNGTFLPIIQETGKIVIITTRWAETDLAGLKMQEEDSSGRKIWKTIDIPAILPDGSSYWPEWWPLEKLARRREEVGETMWQLMYMNNPLGLATGEFKIDMLRIDLPNPLPKIRDIVLSIDLAASDSNYSDYTVIAAIARDLLEPYNVYVLWAIRGKWSFSELFVLIAESADQIFGEYGKLDAVLFEKHSFQGQWAESLREKRPDLPIKVVPTKGDKSERLKAVALKAQARRLFIAQSIPCIAAIQSELIAFPKAQHDDTADALSLPFQYWGGSERKSKLILVRSKHLG